MQPTLVRAKEERAMTTVHAPTGEVSFRAQLTAIHRWGQPIPADLASIHPVLLMNGDSDKMVPTTNTVDLHRRLPNSQLVIYPDARARLRVPVPPGLRQAGFGVPLRAER
jgi:pimeloyl-ACP methyl ester carboxylesterase